MTTDSKNETAQRVGSVATGSLPVWSAEFLLQQWERELRKADKDSDYWGNLETGGGDYCRGRANGYRACIRQLRTEVARAKKRQPEENN